MKTKHHLTCNAPICNDDRNPNYKDEMIWRPGELVCKRRPYERFQLKQLEINKWFKKGKFTKKNDGYTANMLETLSI